MVGGSGGVGAAICASLAEIMGGRIWADSEPGAGSDVAGIETTITYVPETQEFEVNSETPDATKAYIGNAARDGSMAVVFGLVFGFLRMVPVS